MLSVVVERLDVGRDVAEVVDIRCGLEEEDRGEITVVDFGVEGVLMLKPDEATDDDFPAVLCDREELAEDRVLALTPDPDPVREESVDREATLAKDARVINTFLIAVC